MNIKKIQKLKNNQYKLTIDDEIIITFDNVILENNILYKNEIDDNLYKKILNDTKYYEIYNKTVKYILKKRRCEKEVEEYLLTLEIGRKVLDKIILQLKNNSLINDVEYCKAYINDNVYLSKKGINKIKNELIKKNIPIDIVENELNKVSIYQLNNKLEKLVIKKIKFNKKYSNNYLKQKILNEMIVLGYNREDILMLIENNLNDESLILKQEFDKIYTKLSEKYKGQEFMSKLKNKLLSKGFNMQEILILLNEKKEE